MEKTATIALGSNVNYYWRVPEKADGKRLWRQVDNPMQLTVTKRLQFSAGHRVVGHESKCRHLHGHNWVALITAQAWSLDPVGRVIDFSVIKQKIGGWIDENWDHGFVLWKDDWSAMKAMEAFTLAESMKQKVYYLPSNPTAENLARHILFTSREILKDFNIEVTKVVMWETENGFAEASI